MASGEELGSGQPGYVCCKFRGSLLKVNSTTGDVVWKTYTIPDEARPFKTLPDGREMWGPGGAAIWSAPAIDTKRGVVYAATGNSYTEIDVPASDSIAAFDLKSGGMLWHTQVTPGR